MENKDIIEKKSVENDTGLSVDEINNLLQESKFKEIPTINIFGKKIGTESLIITSVAILLWIIIWKVFDLFALGNFTIMFFIYYIIKAVFNVYNSSTDTEISVEMAVNEHQNQIIRIVGVFGSIIILFAFLYQIKMNNDNNKILCYKVLTISLIMFCVSLGNIDPKNDSRNIRNIRLIIQKIYDEALILFMLTIYLIFLGIKNNF